MQDFGFLPKPNQVLPKFYSNFYPIHPNFTKICPNFFQSSRIFPKFVKKTNLLWDTAAPPAPTPLAHGSFLIITSAQLSADMLYSIINRKRQLMENTTKARGL